MSYSAQKKIATAAAKGAVVGSAEAKWQKLLSK